jgi:hypothetical protein
VKAVLLGLLLFAGSAHAKLIQFLYIEASEGNSSGGHVAVQLGDDVYHYQYENALIRLFKHKAEAFRVNYQLLQNRTIHIADIAVSDAVYERISSYFKVRFFGQTQQLRHLAALEQDQALLQALLQWKAGKPVTALSASQSSLKLPGAGLFYGDGNFGALKTAGVCDTKSASANIIAKLKQQLEGRYGKEFLTQKIIAADKALRQLSPLARININNSSSYAFSERYSDLLNGFLVLQVLQKTQSLTNSACFEVNLPGMKLKDEEIHLAEAFRQGLLKSAQSLMVSKRPDWGYALFVTLARLIVIEHSIQTQHWTFLDDTDEKAIAIPQQQLTLYAEQLQKQRHGDLKDMLEVVSDLGEGSGAYERRYVNLEIAANRYQQWLKSDQTGELRHQSEQALPDKSIPLTDFLLTDLSTEQLEAALHHQEQAGERQLKEDSDRNAYHLLTKNCVTALLENINEAVAGQSKQMLGGFVDPQLNFIPFQAFDSVQETYKVVNSRELPAYRQQELTKMYGREVDSWVYARESNVFSSSLYNHNSDDAWFVFFTDDAVLLRPLFGAVNTLAATSQSVWGLFNLPFDEGRGLKIGARGVLTSLPELAFFNIRKGSYPYPIEHPEQK